MESLDLPPREALISEPSRSLIKAGESPIELLLFSPPALLEVPRKGNGASEHLFILILRHRLGRHPGLVSEENLGRRS
jgi:hypothetical protein